MGDEIGLLLCIFKTIDVIRFYKKYTNYNSFFNEIKKWFIGRVTVFMFFYCFIVLLWIDKKINARITSFPNLYLCRNLKYVCLLSYF